MKTIVKINPHKGYTEVAEVWAVACFYCPKRFAKKADDGNEFAKKAFRKGWVKSPNGVWHCPKCAAEFAAKN